MQTVVDFLRHRCTVSPGVKTTSKELYDEYRRWAGHGTALRQKTFIRAVHDVLQDAGVSYGVHRFSDGKRRRGFAGLSVTPAAPPAREVTPTQAARMLNVSRPTVYKLLESGELLGRRVDNAGWRISADDVDNLAGTPGRYQMCATVYQLLRAAYYRALQRHDHGAAGVLLRTADKVLALATDRREYRPAVLSVYEEVARLVRDDSGLETALRVLREML